MLERDVAVYLSYHQIWRDEELWRCPIVSLRGICGGPEGFHVKGLIDNYRCEFGFTNHHDWHRFAVHVGTPAERIYTIMIRKGFADYLALGTWLELERPQVLKILLDPKFQQDGMFFFSPVVLNWETGETVDSARLFVGEGRIVPEKHPNSAKDANSLENLVKYFCGLGTLIDVQHLALATKFLRQAHQTPTKFDIQPMKGGYIGPLPFGLKPPS